MSEGSGGSGLTLAPGGGFGVGGRGGETCPQVQSGVDKQVHHWLCAKRCRYPNWLEGVGASLVGGVWKGATGCSWRRT